jgi:hypothetical protein
MTPFLLPGPQADDAAALAIIPSYILPGDLVDLVDAAQDFYNVLSPPDDCVKFWIIAQYNRGRHLSPYKLAPARGLTSFAFFDSWHIPSIVLGQITMANRLIFIDTVKLMGSDIRTLIETMVLPLIHSPKWKDKARVWRVGGDCTMKNPDQSNRQKSAAKVVEEYFPDSMFEPGPTKWETMKLGIANAL